MFGCISPCCVKHTIPLKSAQRLKFCQTVKLTSAFFLHLSHSTHSVTARSKSLCWLRFTVGAAVQSVWRLWGCELGVCVFSRGTTFLHVTTIMISAVQDSLHDLQRAACQRSVMSRVEAPPEIPEYFSLFRTTTTVGGGGRRDYPELEEQHLKTQSVSDDVSQTDEPTCLRSTCNIQPLPHLSRFFRCAFGWLKLRPPAPPSGVRGLHY